MITTVMETSVYKVGLVILMGIPASGKTSLAHRLLATAPLPAIALHIDDLAPPPEEDSSPAVRPRDRALWQVQQAIAGPWRGVIILDDTMHLAGMRRPYWRLFRTLASVAIVFVQVTCPLEVALRRDAARVGSARVGERSIWKILRSFKSPTPTQRRLTAQLDTAGVIISAGAAGELWATLQQLLAQSMQLKSVTSPSGTRFSNQSPTPHDGNWRHRLHLALNQAASQLIKQIRHSHGPPTCDQVAQRIARVLQSKRHLYSQLCRQPAIMMSTLPSDGLLQLLTRELDGCQI